MSGIGASRFQIFPYLYKTHTASLHPVGVGSLVHVKVDSTNCIRFDLGRQGDAVLLM